MAEVKSSRNFSVVFTKKKVWTSAVFSGIVVAKEEKNPCHEGGSQTMKSVISELYNGEIFPVETETLKDEKYRRTVNNTAFRNPEMPEQKVRKMSVDFLGKVWYCGVLRKGG